MRTDIRVRTLGALSDPVAGSPFSILHSLAHVVKHARNNRCHVTATGEPASNSSGNPCNVGRVNRLCSVIKLLLIGQHEKVRGIFPLRCFTLWPADGGWGRVHVSSISNAVVVYLFPVSGDSSVEMRLHTCKYFNILHGDANANEKLVEICGNSKSTPSAWRDARRSLPAHLQFRPTVVAAIRH